MSLVGPFKSWIEQPPHDLLVVSDVTILVQTEHMGFTSGILVGDGDVGVAHKRESIKPQQIARTFPSAPIP